MIWHSVVGMAQAHCFGRTFLLAHVLSRVVMFVVVCRWSLQHNIYCVMVFFSLVVTSLITRLGQGLDICGVIFVIFVLLVVWLWHPRFLDKD